jgi:hypothetical protein
LSSVSLTGFIFLLGIAFVPSAMLLSVMLQKATGSLIESERGACDASRVADIDDMQHDGVKWTKSDKECHGIL